MDWLVWKFCISYAMAFAVTRSLPTWTPKGDFLIECIRCVELPLSCLKLFWWRMVAQDLTDTLYVGFSFNLSPICTLLCLCSAHAFSLQCFSDGRKGGMAAEDKCIFHYYRFSPLLRWQWEQPLLKHLFSAPRRFPVFWTQAKQKSNLNITGN